ncbi:UNKNOWN [Stylonychia lemnae]|uniref:Uncharacterized protein n=1 Tax=Stylonychia lemnae TaxID=5949 RepID=A0A078A4P8_STYLE|nr:UNKNOWN [Stylonychia lemnae]|eukprot:CDW77245.1 UNKNOWN [Stylonychia lemnae]
MYINPPIVENGYQGPKKSYRCTQCNINKRYDQFCRENRTICLKCHQLSIDIEVKVDKTHYGNLDQGSIKDFLDFNDVMPCDSLSQIDMIKTGSKRFNHETTLEEELQMTRSIKRQRIDQLSESIAVSTQIKNLEVQPTLTVISNPQMTTTKEVEYVVISTHDQDAVTKLKSIEQGDLQEFQCAQILHKHAHLLAQDIVLNYAVQSKSQKLVDTILQVLRRGKELNDQEIIGLALVSLLRGDACLHSTVRLLNSLEQSISLMKWPPGLSAIGCIQISSRFNQ